MFELIDKFTTPQCGWSYKIRPFAINVTAGTFPQLIEKVERIYRMNKTEIPENLPAIIENDICMRSPSGLCKGSHKSTIGRLIVTARAIQNGTNALAMILKKGVGAFVKQEVAEERASICAECPMNVRDPACMSCSGFDYVIQSVRKGRTTSKDSEIKSCAICQCFIKALVHVNVDVLKASTPKKTLDKYPEHCWKVREIKGEQK